jgi:predicted nucleotidyltransferase
MLKSYASYFVSYLLFNLDNQENISKIFLFGSVAKEEETKDSDVDIFIEVKKNLKNFEKKVSKIEKEFYSSREALVFKTRGINNKINVLFGKLKDWNDLRDSIESTGIILYGNYSPSGIKGKKHILFFWEKIGKNRGAFLNKLYGFSSGGRRYEGLISKLGGKKLGKSSFVVPIEHREEFVKLMKKYEVRVKMIEVWF